MRRLNNDKYLLTPEFKIKMGKYVYNEHGVPSIDVKKSKSGDHELVPITTIIDILSQIYAMMLSKKCDNNSSSK